MLPTTSEYLTPDMINREYPGLTPRWLARRRRDGRTPTHIKVGNRVLYRRLDIEALLAASLVQGAG